MDKNDKIFGIVCVICIIVFLLTFPSCKEIQYVPIHTTDTLVVNNFIRDSIKEKDSVYIFNSNETLYVYREKVLYRDKIVVDTFKMIKYEEIPVEVEKVVEVKKPYSLWEKILMWCGVAFIMGVISIVMYNIKK